MPKTIAQLKREAEEARRLALEKESVLAKLRKTCENYRFVADDLYPKGRWPGDEPEAVQEADETSELPPNVVRFTAGKQYRDSEGNIWNGRGRRPKWIVQALGEGASIEDFEAR